jgi:hypothetical protein
VPEFPSACANGTLPAIAPKLAQALGEDEASISCQVSLPFGSTLFCVTFGGSMVARLGPARTA